MEVPTLMFGTIGIAIVIAVLLLVKFLKKPRNRHPMNDRRERNIDEIRRDGPNDAR